MSDQKRKVGRPQSGERKFVRASVSMPPDTYRTLVALAKQKKVSTAWVLREAAEKYINDQWPLLEHEK